MRVLVSGLLSLIVFVLAMVVLSNVFVILFSSETTYNFALKTQNKIYAFVASRTPVFTLYKKAMVMLTGIYLVVDILSPSGPREETKYVMKAKKSRIGWAAKTFDALEDEIADLSRIEKTTGVKSFIKKLREKLRIRAEYEFEEEVSEEFVKGIIPEGRVVSDYGSIGIKMEEDELLASYRLSEDFEIGEGSIRIRYSEKYRTEEELRYSKYAGRFEIVGRKFAIVEKYSYRDILEKREVIELVDESGKRLRLFVKRGLETSIEESEEGVVNVLMSDIYVSKSKLIDLVNTLVVDNNIRSRILEGLEKLPDKIDYTVWVGRDLEIVVDKSTGYVKIGIRPAQNEPLIFYKFYGRVEGVSPMEVGVMIISQGKPYERKVIEVGLDLGRRTEGETKAFVAVGREEFRINYPIVRKISARYTSKTLTRFLAVPVGYYRLGAPYRVLRGYYEIGVLRVFERKYGSYFEKHGSAFWERAGRVVSYLTITQPAWEKPSAAQTIVQWGRIFAASATGIDLIALGYDARDALAAAFALFFGTDFASLFKGGAFVINHADASKIPTAVYLYTQRCWELFGSGKEDILYFKDNPALCKTIMFLSGTGVTDVVDKNSKRYNELLERTGVKLGDILDKLSKIKDARIVVFVVDLDKGETICRLEKERDSEEFSGECDTDMILTSPICERKRCTFSYVTLPVTILFGECISWDPESAVLTILPDQIDVMAPAGRVQRVLSYAIGTYSIFCEKPDTLYIILYKMSADIGGG